MAIQNSLPTLEFLDVDPCAPIEKKSDLVLVHKEATHITLEHAVVGSPIPYHPGAIRYFKEKGVSIKG